MKRFFSPPDGVIFLPSDGVTLLANVLGCTPFYGTTTTTTTTDDEAHTIGYFFRKKSLKSKQPCSIENG